MFWCWWAVRIDFGKIRCHLLLMFTYITYVVTETFVVLILSQRLAVFVSAAVATVAEVEVLAIWDVCPAPSGTHPAPRPWFGMVVGTVFKGVGAFFITLTTHAYFGDCFLSICLCCFVLSTIGRAPIAVLTHSHADPSQELWVAILCMDGGVGRHLPAKRFCCFGAAAQVFQLLQVMQPFHIHRLFCAAGVLFHKIAQRRAEALQV